MSTLTDAEQAQIARLIPGSNHAGKWGYDNRSRAVFAAVEEIISQLRESVAREIETSVSYGFGMNYDGTEDRQAMAYVEGLGDAAQIVRGGA